MSVKCRSIGDMWAWPGNVCFAADSDDEADTNAIVWGAITISFREQQQMLAEGGYARAC
jgi:hypothetical protein